MIAGADKISFNSAAVQTPEVVRDAPAIDWRGRYKLFTAGGLTAAPTLEAVVAGMAQHAPGASGGDAAWFAQLSRVMRQAYADRLEGLGAATAECGGLRLAMSKSVEDRGLTAFCEPDDS